MRRAIVAGDEGAADRDEVGRARKMGAVGVEGGGRADGRGLVFNPAGVILSGTIVSGSGGDGDGDGGAVSN